ncbi:MAG: hypothetical protein QN183_04850 [Armatimonadota bacterium]|nr:hypothetical protein [Armatimonadota bacterium]MDR7532458.1 hypothetical protein [Armatimonadota bacterium]MDR7535681.1 hypothetical protein [Armatimonadota bacterium]
MDLLIVRREAVTPGMPQEPDWVGPVSIMGPQGRVQLFPRQQEIFAEELPSVPLYVLLDLTPFPTALRGPRPVGLGSDDLPRNAWERRWGTSERGRPPGGGFAWGAENRPVSTGMR